MLRGHTKLSFLYFITSGKPVFPDWLQPGLDGLVALGGDLSMSTIVEAYSKGIFPWGGQHPIQWYSPDPRLVLFPADFHASRSLSRSARRQRFDIRFDHDFASTIRHCAETPRNGESDTWITADISAAYGELFQRGIVHTVEVYQDGKLVGGLYGLTLGRCFFGESMFSHATDASKAALWVLCQRLGEQNFHFIDCQCVTEHLIRMGAVPIPRNDFIHRLKVALRFDSLHSSWSSWPNTPTKGLGEGR